jgi:hypothetical protein
MPRENGVNVLRKMREYGTNIVQTVARRWRENGIKKIPTFIGIFSLPHLDSNQGQFG